MVTEDFSSNEVLEHGHQGSEDESLGNLGKEHARQREEGGLAEFS